MTTVGCVLSRIRQSRGAVVIVTFQSQARLARRFWVASFPKKTAADAHKAPAASLQSVAV